MLRYKSNIQWPIEEKLTSPKIHMESITDAQLKKVLQDFMSDLKKLEELKEMKKNKATDSKKRAAR